MHLDRHVGDAGQPAEPRFVDRRGLRLVGNYGGNDSRVAWPETPQMKVGDAVAINLKSVSD